jgi:hypothetical protein
MHESEVISVPSKTGSSNILLSAEDYTVPKGFFMTKEFNGKYVLTDEKGRMNVNHLYEYARQMHPEMSDRSPASWLRTEEGKALRDIYEDLYAFDPVASVSGGNPDTVETPIPALESDNPFQYINRSADGNVQTYGTYLLQALIYHYCLWAGVNPEEHLPHKEICDAIWYFNRFTKSPNETPASLYILHAAGTDIFNVGSSQDPDRRLKGLIQSNPYHLVSLCQLRLDNAAALEKEILEHFKSTALNGEWFTAEAAVIYALIESLKLHGTTGFNEGIVEPQNAEAETSKACIPPIENYV